VCRVLTHQGGASTAVANCESDSGLYHTRYPNDAKSLPTWFTWVIKCTVSLDTEAHTQLPWHIHSSTRLPLLKSFNSGITFQSLWSPNKFYAGVEDFGGQIFAWKGWFVLGSSESVDDLTSVNNLERRGRWWWWYVWFHGSRFDVFRNEIMFDSMCCEMEVKLFLVTMNLSNSWE